MAMRKKYVKGTHGHGQQSGDCGGQRSVGGINGNENIRLKIQHFRIKK